MDNWNGIISLLIACIEIILLINLLIFAKKDKLNKIAILMITVLMIYQALEFLMCQITVDVSYLPFLAFADISLLPPLNLLLVTVLLSSYRKSIYLIFIPAIAFILYYIFTIGQFAVTSCTVSYATYNYPLGDLYGFFYYTPILISIILLIRTLIKNKNPQMKLPVKLLLFGNLFISIPVITGFILMASGNYSIISKIESVMCKFAFVYALCLTVVSVYNTNLNERNNS